MLSPSWVGASFYTGGRPTGLSVADITQGFLDALSRVAVSGDELAILARRSRL
ncbi:MAG: hypothetical protein ACRDOJ_07290 [Nocardioidaceae bacterium]